ncbi:hypothetical protein G6O67_001310 [Ophiocordyceps sinensis]|uniref:Cell wall glucanase n=1 Tax=Ophiocordyceps sinensis TaxID=72228 RepID=A0A8H4PXE7_9HYPO|nr:hypothetical protein G6O67_001310 [Ophiocordyceps sinensis]
MVLGKLWLPAIALGPLVAGHAAVHSAARPVVKEERVVLYDSTGAEPTEVPRVVYVTEGGEVIGSATEDAQLSSVDKAWKDRLLTGAHLSSPGAFPPSADQDDIHRSSTPTSSGKPKPMQTGTDDSSRVQPFNSSDATSRGSPTKSFGVSYSPYHANHKCKSKKEISQDFERFVKSSLRRFGKSYSMVRIYGTDCDQVAPIRTAAKAHDMKVFLGDWSMVDTVSVGNELVDKDKMFLDNVVRAVDETRSALRDAGYQGPVVTVDTFSAYIANPDLARASDYCAVNAHAFFNPTISAPQAGRWLQDTVQQVKVESACGGSKRVVVTETGWPTHGLANGRAVPGSQNQKLAMDSITQKFSANAGDVVLFSAFNDLWKEKNVKSFEAEQFWGITE